MPAVVDAIARAQVLAQFEHAFAYRLGITEGARFNPLDDETLGGGGSQASIRPRPLVGAALGQVSRVFLQHGLQPFTLKQIKKL